MEKSLYEHLSKFALIKKQQPGDYHTKWSKSDRERQISYDIAYMWNLKKKNTNQLFYKTETDSQRTNLWLPAGTGGGEG